MYKKPSKKLQLDRTTIRQLTDDLAAVNGGARPKTTTTGDLTSQLVCTKIDCPTGLVPCGTIGINCTHP